MKKKKQSGKRVVCRREIGLQILTGSKAIPSCYVIYEETLEDGTIRLHRGRAMRSVPGFGYFSKNKREKEIAHKTLLPPGYDTMLHSASIVQAELMRHCMNVDEELDGLFTGWEYDKRKTNCS